MMVRGIWYEAILAESMSEQAAVPQARVDAAGRPLEGRGRQALMSLSILVSWVCMMLIVFWATRGDGPGQQAWFFWGIAAFAWLAAEAFGGRRALVWPASALVIAGSLSLGFGMGLSNSVNNGPDAIQAMMVISGTASVNMIAYLFRFRLPGLVSPIITFAIIALFLSIYGVDREGLSQVEGLSPRGILAALINNPWWMALFGLLGLVSVTLARWLDLKGDDFGVASARPLHLVGAGVVALIAGRILGWLPVPFPLIMILGVWMAGYAWSIRINRFAVLIAIHFAITKPLIAAYLATARPMIASLDELLPANDLMTVRLDMSDWALILLGIFIADLVLWFRMHKFALDRGWILGPGGRIPQPRKGWLWRYWPYA